jgi:hypothetical protein
MMKKLIGYFFLSIPMLCFAQIEENTSVVSANYLEDQIYLGLHYNLLGDKPNDVFQRNFSYGLQVGVLRDIPLTTNGRVALGIGMGYAVNSYYSNIISTKANGIISYQVAEDDFDYNRSKFQTHSLELPLEFRWRNSTRNRYKFFRIYSGFKFNYNFSNLSKLVTDAGKTSFSNSDIEKFQYGLTLNVGYNTFNLHLYYALSDFMKENTVLDTGESLSLKPLRIGLIFYLL